MLFVIVEETNIKEQSVLGTQPKKNLSNSHSITATTVSRIHLKGAAISV